MELFATYFLVGGLICAGVGGYIAGEKKRNALAWAILCFFTSIFGIIAIVAVPSLVNLLDKEFWRTAKIWVLKASIRRDTDLRVSDEDGLTPLHLAVVMSEKPEVVALLLDKGADIEAHDKNGKTPLHRSVSYEKHEMVTLLLNRGADTEARDRNENTPLHDAARSGKGDIVRLLLNRGADIEAREKNGNTLLYNLVSCYEKPEMATLLLSRGADIDARDRNGKTLLYNFVSCKKPETVTLLLDKGADIDARDRNGKSPLHEAVISEKSEMVTLLLNRGADIEGRDGNGDTSLHQAVTFEKSEMVTLLLDKGADIEAHDKSGETPLHRAVSSKNTKMVKLLLDKGADIEARDKNGNTLLHRAVSSKNTKMVKLLLNKGADTEARDKNGNTLLHRAVSSKNTKMVKLLLDKGAGIEARDKNRNTPLQSAVKSEKIDIVALLLNKGADTEARDKNGNTLLHRAVSSKNTKMVKLLLDKGADIEARDKNRNTPLQLARDVVYKGKDCEHHVKSVANESLAIFSKISDAVKSELNDKPTRNRYNVFAFPNTLPSGAIENLMEIRQGSRQNYRNLARKPADIRVVTKDAKRQETIYYISRATPVRIKGAKNIKFASYHAPVGRLASLPVGGKIIAKAEFQPLKDADGWDSKDTVIESKSCDLITIESLRSFLKDTDKKRAKRFIEGRRRGIRYKMELNQFILNQYQDEIFRLPLDSCILLSGAPGTGKTTTLIRRLSQKLDVEFLSDNEKRKAGINNLEAESNHSKSWIMFTPTEFLKLYVKEAFNREGIPDPDGRINTWDEFRIDLACNRFGILRSASSGGFYVLKETSLILKNSLKTDLIDWFKDFDRSQKKIFLKEMRDYAEKISSEESSSEISQIGKKLLAILGTDDTELETIFASLLTKTEQIQKIVKNIKKPSYKKTKLALKQFVNPVERYINGIPKRYGLFREESQKKKHWYCVEGFSPTDIHPLEVDIVLLAMIRAVNGLIEGVLALNSPDNPAYKTLGQMQDLYRTQVLVDEVSDFSPIQLSCMIGIARPGVKSFFACGDFHQRVTGWGTCSIEQMEWAIPNINTREIHIPYRQSRQLHNFAEQIIRMSGGDIADAKLPEYKNNEGFRPVLATYMSEVSEIANCLSQRIREINQLVGKLPSIAILVNSEKEVQSFANALEDALADQNIRVISCLKGQTHSTNNAVRVFSVGYIKGLEFEAVFFVGIDKLAEKEPDLFDKYLYVGATRAATYLGITCERELPPMMEELRGLFGDDWKIDNKKKNALEIGYESSGNTPLHLKGRKKLRMVELLLDNGADMNVLDGSGETFLHWATRNEMPEVVELLIKKGMNIDSRDKYGNTSLQLAVKRENTEMIEFLLSMEANINARDRNENTSLHDTTRNENTEMLEFLLDREADIEACDGDGNTPLQLAAKLSKTPKVIALLLDRGAEVNARNFDNNTPLHNVILNPHLSFLEQDALIEVLLKMGADTNIQSDQGKTAFELFKEGKKNYELKSRKAYWQLFSAKLNKRDKNNKGLFDNHSGSSISIPYLHSRCSKKPIRVSQKARWDIIWQARWEGREIPRINKLLESKFWVMAEIKDVTKLFDDGADIDACDRNGWTPLHMAAAYSRAPKIVALLLDRGADMQACAKDGCTPLHVAVESKTPEVVELLLKRRASIEVRNEKELTPLHFSVSACENPQVVSLLLRRGAYLKVRDEDGNTPLHLAVKGKTAKVVSLLLDEGAELEAVAENGVTPLHCAAGSNALPVVVTLLDRKANIEARDKDGWTPLHSATRNQNLEIVELLLSRDADIEACAKDGYRPLHWAARFSKASELAKLLLDRGADIEACAKDGYRPLHLAAQGKTPEVISLLLDRGANAKLQDNEGKTPFAYAKENRYIKGSDAYRRLKEIHLDTLDTKRRLAQRQKWFRCF